MEKNIVTYLLYTFISLLSCNPIEPIEEEVGEKWELITELSNLSVRYIQKYNGTIYLSAIEPERDYNGVIYKTNDGINWHKLKSFNNSIGPMTLNGDSLFILGDSLFKYIIPSEEWENICQPSPLSSDPGAIGDMIFLNNELFAMQSLFSDAVATYKIHFDGSVEEILVYNGYSYGGAKFIKEIKNAEKIYVRGQYYKGGFYTFDGNIFDKLDNGLTAEVWLNPPTNSVAVKNDTLFAGFKFPGVIKILNNNQWINYTDTLPYSKSAFLFNPIIRTETTAITFINERMFVGTQSIGVLEWKNEGWKQVSEGLVSDPVTSQGYKDLYRPVVFLESINNTLIVAYGEPGYAPWGGNGVYKFKIKN